MQKKHIWLAASLSLTVAVSILINLATSQTPPRFLQPILGLLQPFTWPLLILSVLLSIGAGIQLAVVQAPSEQKTPKNQYRQHLLAEVDRTWIKDFLEQSLDGMNIISPEFYEQSDAVSPPRPKYPYRTVNKDKSYTHIEQAYEDAGEQLLILGEPGVGKTTLLLKLTQLLLVERAEKDEASPIPVIFPLSSWAVKRQPLVDWLIEELYSNYRVPPKLGKTWIENDDILPLLDGLDEVDSKHRVGCVEAINTFIRERGLISMVVCSRVDEYLKQSVRLSLQKAIVIKPLTQQQVDTYCSDAGESLEEVRKALQGDPLLQELVTTPLMLSVLTRTFPNKSIDTLQRQVTSPTIGRKQIFTAYVEHMLESKGIDSPYTKQQTLHWLTWLAQQLSNHNNQTQFYLERIQPDWLPDGWLRRLIAGIPAVITAGLTPSLFILLLNPFLEDQEIPYSTTIFFMILGILCGFIYMLLHDGKKVKIELFEVINWEWRLSWNAFIKEVNAMWATTSQEFPRQKLRLSSLLGSLLSVLGWIVFFGLMDILFDAIFHYDTHTTGILGTHYSLVWPGFSRLGLAFFIGLTVMIFFFLLGILWYAALGLWKLLVMPLNAGLSVRALEDRERTRTNVGVWRSAINGLVLSLVAGIGSGLIYGHFFSVYYGLLVALNAAVIVWFWCGGYGCFQHLTLRLLLRYMDFAPLNYPRFLDYAAKRVLLRKAGGRYIFFHKTFQEYLVEMNAENVEQFIVCSCGYKENSPSARFCPNCGKPIEVEDKQTNT